MNGDTTLAAAAAGSSPVPFRGAQPCATVPHVAALPLTASRGRERKDVSAGQVLAELYATTSPCNVRQPTFAGSLRQSASASRTASAPAGGHYFSPTQAATHLAVHRATIIRSIVRGDLFAIKAVRQWRIPHHALAGWLERGQGGARGNSLAECKVRQHA